MEQRPRRLPPGVAGLFFFDPGVQLLDDGSARILTADEMEARELADAMGDPPNHRGPFINTVGYEKLRILKP